MKYRSQPQPTETTNQILRMKTQTKSAVIIHASGYAPKIKQAKNCKMDTNLQFLLTN
jgi:hypothetical protein